ncbi:hypothetical protein [Anoxybacteroides rupiense]|uniref:hypothetical protein n=1 Tax=Anoxybacteroides rupiense TaxID=311460 RepID=UPI001F09D2A8|nr:hypothetical protein [Anoxybacillus rupiensis]
MQIYHDWMVQTSIASQDGTAPLKEGDTVFVAIKEKVSANEAIVTIKGQDRYVRFQGNIPDKEKLVVQITGMDCDVLEVKAVSPSAAAQAMAGNSLAPIEQLLRKQGLFLTQAEREALKSFLEKTKGTMAEKLETIQALASKKLPLTSLHMQAVHEALHGEPLGDLLMELVEETKESPEVKETSPKPPSDQKNGTAAENTSSWIGNETDSGTNMETVQWTYGHEEWFSGITPQAKELVVRTVTEKMAQATGEFQSWQREIGQKLEQAASILTARSTQVRSQARMSIEAAVYTLDRMILRGECMMFADMGTEKQLLQASAKLAEAKQLISAGKWSDAASIVQEVRQTVSSLRFQPADVKIQRFISEIQASPSASVSNQPLAGQIGRLLPAAADDFSARGIFEQLRLLGMHHEKEIAQAVMTQTGPLPSKNMKSLLLSAGEGGYGTASQAERAVLNLTGQQLLSRFEAKSHTQTMVYQLPLMMRDQMETVHVYLNSRNEDGKLDWQNCSLYFLLDTEQYGKIGLLLQAAERNLAITVKTDHEQVESALKPLMEAAKEHLNEIGYHVTKMTFAKMTEPAVSSSLQTPSASEKLQEKGYDITV